MFSYKHNTNYQIILLTIFYHIGGAFPFTIGRIEHGFNVRPDLCAVENNVNPRSGCVKKYFHFKK